MRNRPSTANTAVDDSDLDGRVAVVTGAGRGIGAAVARELVRRGVRTVLVARSLDEVTETSRRLQDEGGIAIPMAADLSDPARGAEIVAAATDRLGAVDLLVNNAAAVGPLGSAVAVPVSEWSATIQLNLVTPAALISAALPGMLDRGFGRIVNVTSGAAGGTGMLHASAYSASKAALEMLTRNLGAEFAGTGVAVCAVRPGRVDTELQRSLRSRTVEEAGPTIVERARAFLEDGQLIDPCVPAILVARVMERGFTGAVVSVYDDVGRALLRGTSYVGDGVT